MAVARVLTIEQAAKFWQLSRRTLENHLRSGRIYAFKVGGAWRVPIAEDGSPLQKETTQQGV